MGILPRRKWLKILLLLGGSSTLVMAGFLGLILLTVMGLLGASQAIGTQASGGNAYSASPVIPKSGGTTAGQQEFAGALVACSGLDPNVALAWAVQEGGGVNDGQPPNNFLFLTAVTGGFRSFASPEEAAIAVCQTLQARQYAGILASIGLAPTLQLIAIYSSPWDGGYVPLGDPSGHYGGDGRNLVSTYYRLIGNTACQNRGQPC